MMNYPVLIERSAFKHMNAIVKNSPVEIGSILLGVIADYVVVLAAGKPGEQSIQEPARFVHDVAEDQRSLQEARQQHGQQIIILGGFHKHPSGMHQYSAQDNRQAQEILQHNNDGKPVLVGIFAANVRGHAPHLFLYVLESVHSNLTPIEYEIVKRTDARVVAAVKQAPVTPDLAGCSFWYDSDFQFYVNPIGRDRIRIEITELKTHGWNVRAIRHSKTRQLMLVMQQHRQQLIASFPPEYPLNPPRLFDSAGCELLGLPDLVQWNSDRRLSTVVLSRNQSSVEMPKYIS